MQISAVKLLCIDDEKTTYLKNWSLLNSNYGKPYLNSSSVKQTKNKHPIFRLENKTKYFDLSKKDLCSKPCLISNPQLPSQKRGREQKVISRKGFYKPSKTRTINKQSILSLSPTQQMFKEQRNCSTLNLFNLSSLQKSIHQIKQDNFAQLKGCVFSNMKIAYSLEKNDFRMKSKQVLQIIDRGFSKSQFKAKPIKQAPLYFKTEFQEKIDKIRFSKFYNNNTTAKKRRILRYRPIKLEQQATKHLKIV